VCWVSLAVAQSPANQDYLAGRKAEASGDVAAATANYQAVVSRNALLKEYALWRLARIARATGDLVLERERLQRLVATAPNSLLYETAALRLAESFFESGDFESAATSAKAVASSKNIAVAREAQTLMGTAYVRAGKTAEARDAFTKLVMQMPDASRPDDFALTAVRELDALDKSAGTSNLTEAELLLRASVYQFNRDFAGARVHYQTLIDRFPQSGTVPNASFQLARGLYNEAKYDETIKVIQTLLPAALETNPQTARDATALLASTYVRLKRTVPAVATYRIIIDNFRDNPNPERAYLNIIDVLHEDGRHEDALFWVQKTRTQFKSDLGGTLALFAQLRIHLAQASWAAAVRDAEELAKASDLGGTRVPGGTSATEVAFLRAYALEQSGRTEEAVAAYLAIPDGRNEYYGARATQRLLALANGDKSKTLVQMRLNALTNEARVASAAGQWEPARVAATSALRLTNDPQRRSELLTVLRNAYDSLAAYRLPKFNQIQFSFTPATGADPSATHEALAEALLALDLYDEAVPEYLATAAAKNTVASSDQAYTIARLSLQAGLPNRAIRFAEPVWKNIPADYVIDLAPREMVELLYPVPFRESLLKHAASRNVDERFVLSIARQASRFQVEAKSVAAARGMMQNSDATANEIATQVNQPKFQQDDLYNADTAILFGSQYLANLFKQFPDQPQAVAGSYNGGADNLARWIARSRSTEADRYVAEIGFSQTKDYVYKVLANFWTYQRLYDAKLEPAK
jgi:soluble lytic murein transglycosylase-like protein/TolA-binding protein